MTDVSDKATIIDYWRAVELFSPQKAPSVTQNYSSANYFNDDDLVCSAQEDVPLPWEAKQPLKFRKIQKDKAQLFQVYCGIYSLEKMRNILEDKFGKDPEVFDERSDGESCLFTFSVSDDGRPLFDTFVLSTCAWAIARTLNPGPESAEWLMGFDTVADKIASGFAERLTASQDDAVAQSLKGEGVNLGRPLEYADIFQETDRIIQDLGVSRLSENFEIRIKTVHVDPRYKYAADNQDFLNSFFVNDLGKVAVEVRKKNIGNGMGTFLTRDDELDISKRIDIRTSIDTLFHQLSPECVPPGRWPNNGHYPLVFSQQFAMNALVQNLMKGTGLFAINGPPGAGKTTLLRDLIAAVVVERATSLAELACPEDAFAGEKRWKMGKYTRVISTWKDAFKGFEIVVASNNNGAVENVTLEIPGQDAVDPTWREQIDYFPDLATYLINQPAWAMIAARLGNKVNRHEFAKRFWYQGNDKGGFLARLKDLGTQPVAFEKTDWKESVQRFKKVLGHERNLRDKRLRVHQTYLEVFKLLQEIPTLEMQLQNLKAEHNLAAQQFHAVQAHEKMSINEVDAARERQLNHRRNRPNILEIICSLGKVRREWRETDKTLERLVEQAERKLTKLKSEATAWQQTVVSLDQEIRQTTDALDQNRGLLSAANDELNKAKVRFGAYVPLPETWNHEIEARELSSPWADPEWNEARARVFIEALQLHKAFIFANADRLRKSLQGVMDILDGTAPKTPEMAEGVAAAWTTLFFVIPVISTTFASFDRLFSHLGRESIGWLLIDEAGQAVPQAAVGAIWRAKRSVVVGDPLQLEPVTIIPFTVQQAVRRYYKVDETWLPGQTSVQQLTDRVSLLGTYLKGQDDTIWVGSPLRVHRRCDQPMFDISNNIAYDGLMVFGTPPRPTIALPLSNWIHVESYEARGHWIPAEGQAVETLIRDLIRQNMSADDIFLISPFRDVVKRLYQFTRVFKVKTGTIHTVQGKEAEVVILVLGGNPHRPGAKQWASKRPNLLNVAVSRAKRRLYVIGNQKIWEKYRYFDICSENLK
jgi:hypothetical protein